MDTSEYTTKKERKQAKKITRHPIFQKMRQRVIVTEASGPELQKKLTSTTSKLDATNNRVKELEGKIEQLTGELQGAMDALEAEFSASAVKETEDV